MIEDVRNLSDDDKIHSMILSMSLISNIVNYSPYTPGVLGGTRQSVVNYFDDNEQIPDDELYTILKEISDKVYYITDSPTFDYVDNDKKVVPCRVGTLSFLNVEELSRLVSSEDYKNKFLIFYNLTKSQGRYNIRLSAIDDIIQIRNNKINDILGE